LGESGNLMTRDRMGRCEGESSCRKGKSLYSLKMVERW